MVARLAFLYPDQLRHISFDDGPIAARGFALHPWAEAHWQPSAPPSRRHLVTDKVISMPMAQSRHAPRTPHPSRAPHCHLTTRLPDHAGPSEATRAHSRKTGSRQPVRRPRRRRRVHGACRPCEATGEAWTAHASDGLLGPDTATTEHTLRICVRPARLAYEEPKPRHLDPLLGLPCPRLRVRTPVDVARRVAPAAARSRSAPAGGGAGMGSFTGAAG